MPRVLDPACTVAYARPHEVPELFHGPYRPVKPGWGPKGYYCKRLQLLASNGGAYLREGAETWYCHSPQLHHPEHIPLNEEHDRQHDLCNQFLTFWRRRETSTRENANHLYPRINRRAVEGSDRTTSSWYSAPFVQDPRRTFPLHHKLS